MLKYSRWFIISLINCKLITTVADTYIPTALYYTIRVFNRYLRSSSSFLLSPYWSTSVWAKNYYFVWKQHIIPSSVSSKNSREINRHGIGSTILHILHTRLWIVFDFMIYINKRQLESKKKKKKWRISKQIW